MARHLGIYLSAALAVFMMSARTANAEIDEKVLILSGPQLIELTQCYQREAISRENSCKLKSLSDTIQSVIQACSDDANKVTTAMRNAASPLERPSLEQVTAELRGWARIRIEKQITKLRENPKPCVHLL